MSDELNDRGHMDFVFIEDFDKEAFPEYASMSASQRTSLPSTNFWRSKNGMPLIPVPQEDKYYYYYFRDTDNVNYVNTNVKKKKK